MDAQEHGPEDVRTSLGYYNLSKVFQSRGQMAKSLAYNDMVMHIWSSALHTLVLGEEPRTRASHDNLPIGRSQLLEVVAMLQVRAPAAFFAEGTSGPERAGRTGLFDPISHLAPI